MAKANMSISTASKQICLAVAPDLNTPHGTLAMQKSTTFEPHTETKVNFEIPHKLENALIESHPDLDSNLHLMDGITSSYAINGKHYVHAIIANFTHSPIVVSRLENVGTYVTLPSRDVQPIDKCLAISEGKPALKDTSHVKNISLIHVPQSFRPRYQALLTSYADVFSRHDLDLGRCSTLPHEVRMTDPNPVSYTHLTLPTICSV